MLEAFEITHPHQNDVTLEVVLSFDERKKSRHRTLTSCGLELGWFVERGGVLSTDDVLKCSDGTLVRVVAADEQVSDVHSADLHLLTRAAYHLGNRHVPLQIGNQFLRYQRDHVLDEMIRGFGLQIDHVVLPFQPESGAYAVKQSHGHSHEH